MNRGANISLASIYYLKFEVLINAFLYSYGNLATRQGCQH